MVCDYIFGENRNILAFDRVIYGDVESGDEGEREIEQDTQQKKKEEENDSIVKVTGDIYIIKGQKYEKTELSAI